MPGILRGVANHLSPVQTAAASSDSSAMDYAVLPHTDLNVSRLCLGCQQFSSAGTTSPHKIWDSMEEDVALATIKAALDNGINFLDTAEAYAVDGFPNQAEVLVGKALQGRRSEAVIAGKFGAHAGTAEEQYTESAITEALDLTLKALGTDYIDMYQVHWRGNMVNAEETLRALDSARRAGKVRHFGVCNFGRNDLMEFAQLSKELGAPLPTNQVPYNLIWRSVEVDIVPVCEVEEVGILAYTPLMAGLLSGKYTDAACVPEGRQRTKHFNHTRTERCYHGGPGAEEKTFRTLSDVQKVCNRADVSMVDASIGWLLAQPSVRSLIVGATSPEQVVENCRSFAVAKALPSRVVAQLSAATEELKSVFGGECDLWQPDGESRFY